MISPFKNRFLAVIEEAITSQRVIQIKHNNTWRTVEPHLVGSHQFSHSHSFYGYCRGDVISGEQAKTSRWQVFHVDELEDIELTLYSFESHSNYLALCAGALISSRLN
jgi:hypothetical protein